MYGLKDFAEIYFQAEDLGFNGIQFKRDEHTQIVLPMTGTDKKVTFHTHENTVLEFTYSQVQEYLNNLDELISLADDIYCGTVFMFVGGKWYDYCSYRSRWGEDYYDFDEVFGYRLYDSVKMARQKGDVFAVAGEGVFF